MEYLNFIVVYEKRYIYNYIALFQKYEMNPEILKLKLSEDIYLFTGI